MTFASGKWILMLALHIVEKPTTKRGGSDSTRTISGDPDSLGRSACDSGFQVENHIPEWVDLTPLDHLFQDALVLSKDVRADLHAD
jgi:hypothetical protein